MLPLLSPKEISIIPSSNIRLTVRTAISVRAHCPVQATGVFAITSCKINACHNMLEKSTLT